MNDNQVEKDTALNDQVEATNPDTTPVPETKAAEEPVAEPTPSTEEVETKTEEPVESPKKGFNNRVRELNARAREAEAKAQSLAEKLAELTGTANAGAPQVISQPVQDEPIVKPGEEIDAYELDRRLREREAKILQKADAMATLRAKQSETVSRINQEAGEAMTAFPELNPDSDSFNRELSDTISEAVEAYVKADPYGASVKKFVSRLMKPYKGAVETEVGKVAGGLAKQVSEAALRPTSVSKPAKSAEDKSIAELEQELGIVQA